MFAVLALVLSLASCSADEKQPADTAAQTEAKQPAKSAVGEASLGALKDALGTSGLLGANTTYLVKGDEYADDVLGFTYGFKSTEAAGVKNFLVSEHGSNEAYTCAVLIGDSADSTALYETASVVLDKYAEELRSTVAPYAPDAASLCEERTITDVSVGGVYAVCLFISDDNAALEKLVTEQLEAIFAAS